MERTLGKWLFLEFVYNWRFGTVLSLIVFTALHIGLKKFATLLPNNWLAETPQTLTSRRLGRQSAERERISEIKREHFFRNNFRQMAFLRIRLQLEVRDGLIPNSFLLHSILD
ncbi:hypothetical protein Q5O89_12120 [Peribacillus frigoritolerans]|nr:hypothetical protein [Peribacillus frigoritolerans]